MDRRELLRAGAVGAAAWLARSLPAHAFETLDFPFTLGVASGEPAHDGFVLWTRLAPQPLAVDGGMPPQPFIVEWEVAADELFASVVRSGTVTSSAESAHSVHVELEKLPPGRWWWYRFRAGGHVSATGMTRTMPGVHEEPARFRFAAASCQDYTSGRYSALRALSAEDVDLVVFLGDYIYARGVGGPRNHAGPAEATSLADYRLRHAQYKTDPALQAAHARFPWVVTFDDNDVANNWAGDHQSASPPEEFLTRRAAALQAFWEHQPLRRASRPRPRGMRMNRQVSFGDLAAMHILDTRSHRTAQPCGDGIKDRCPEAYDPVRTMLGSNQEDWLHAGLDRSRARWNVVAQQVLMAQFDENPGPGGIYGLDFWDGYPLARARFLDFLAYRRPSNPVVLSGDVHAFFANNLTQNFSDAHAPPVAAELVTSSITTPSPLDVLFTGNAPFNPHVRYQNGQVRGYVRCDIDRDGLAADFVAVATVLVDEAPVHTVASFHVEDGVPGLAG